VAPDPEPHNSGDCGCSPNGEQKQVHIGKGKTEVLKRPPNHESAGDSEEKVGPCPESVSLCDFATGPTSQPYGK